MQRRTPVPGSIIPEAQPAASPPTPSVPPPLFADRPVRPAPPPQASVIEPVRVHPVDGVFATAVLSTTRLLARFYWGRSIGHNRPLILLDFDVDPLGPESWSMIKLKLDDLTVERRARVGYSMGMWVEGEALAHQAFYYDLDARPIPDYLTTAEAWHPICQSAAALLAGGQVTQTGRAVRAMEARPFLNAAGVYAGPRTDDPTVPAFLYGIVLGLDEVLARDPHPKKPIMPRR